MCYKMQCKNILRKISQLRQKTELLISLDSKHQELNICRELIENDNIELDYIMWL